jgi:hypothetical protein
LALVALWFWFAERWLRKPQMQRATRALNIAAVFVCLLVAGCFQWARYQDVRGLGREAMALQPAMQAIRQTAAPGALVYCPDNTARESLPLYTDATSFFSVYMMLSETPRTQAAMQERVAATQWLGGASDEAFTAWLKTRPLDVYFQHQQRRIDAQSEARMDEIAAQLQTAFANLQQGQRPAVLASLRYALLPAQTKLETTRLPSVFACKQIWADENFTLYALQKL